MTRACLVIRALAAPMAIFIAALSAPVDDKHAPRRSISWKRRFRRSRTPSKIMSSRPNNLCAGTTRVSPPMTDRRPRLILNSYIPVNAHALHRAGDRRDAAIERFPNVLSPRRAHLPFEQGD